MPQKRIDIWQIFYSNIELLFEIAVFCRLTLCFVIIYTNSRSTMKESHELTKTNKWWKHNYNCLLVAVNSKCRRVPREEREHKCTICGAWKALFKKAGYVSSQLFFNSIAEHKKCAHCYLFLAPTRTAFRIIYIFLSFIGISSTAWKL